MSAGTSQRISPEEVTLVYRIADLFVREKLSPQQISDHLAEDPESPVHVSREGVYPRILRARDLGFIQFVPRPEDELRSKLADAFRLGAAGGRLTVVDAQANDEDDPIAVIAAERVLARLKERAAARGRRGRVTLGLGPGPATFQTAKHLATLLERDSDPPRLRLVAITSGSLPNTPEYASSSFFSLFSKRAAEERIGMFGPLAVEVEAFEALKSAPGIREPFKVLKEIDVIVTSMGDARGQESTLAQFLGTPPDPAWIGDVQLRPYGVSGPVPDRAPDAKRAVTLFDLSDLVKIAADRDKCVVLIARTSSADDASRAPALRPLLTAPELRVWTDLVMDARTARDLLRPPAPARRPRARPPRSRQK